MPSRNVIRIEIPNSYYHVYARGASRDNIFLDDVDYKYFLKLFERYLSTEPKTDSAGRAYAHLFGEIELVAYCLMPNHFHLLLYQYDEKQISALMRGVMTAYSRYFNTKYKKSGSLFESRYKASHISSDEYLYHISRYIHLNHSQWRTWPYSSLNYYITDIASPDWLKPDKILKLFDSKREYADFVADYEDEQRMRDQIKHQLADQ